MIKRKNKFLSVAAVCAAASTIAAVPTAVYATETDSKTIATVTVDVEVAEDARTAEIEIADISEEYVSLTVEGSTDEVSIDSGTATFNVSVLDEDGDIAESKTFTLTYYTDSGEEVSGKLVVNITAESSSGTSGSSGVTVPDDFDPDIDAGEFEIDSSTIEEYTTKTYTVQYDTSYFDGIALGEDPSEFTTSSDGKVTVKLPLTNEDGTEILKGKQTITITYDVIDSDEDITGTITYTVIDTYEEKTVLPEVSDFTKTVTVSEDDTSATIELSDIPDGYVSVKVKGESSSVAITNNSAKIDVDILNESGSAIAETKTYTLIYYTASGDSAEGSLNLTIEVDSEEAETGKISWAKDYSETLTSVESGSTGTLVIVDEEGTFGSTPMVWSSSNNAVTLLVSTDGMTAYYTVGSVSEDTDVTITAYPKGNEDLAISTSFTVKANEDNSGSTNSDISLSYDSSAMSITSTGSLSNIAVGDVLTITPVISDGYAVKSLSVNGNTVEWTSVMTSAKYTVLDSDTTILIDVVFEKLSTSYTITFNDSEISAVNASTSKAIASGSTLESGDKIIVSAVEIDGYELASLKVNDTDITSGTTVIVGNTDITIVAAYTVAQTESYTVTFTDDVSVTVNSSDEISSGETVNEGDILTISAGKTGYTLSSISVNGTSVANGGTYVVRTSDITIETSYTINTTGTYAATLEVYDEDNEEVDDVEITVYDSTGTEVGTYTTDSDGEIELSLVPGRYTFEVESVPDQYALPTSTYTFTISDEGKVRGKVELTLEKTSVTLIKTDSVSNAGVGGIGIAVKNSNGVTVITGTTDSAGKLTIKGLAAGKYTYTESSSVAGYTSDSTVYTFTIEKDGTVTGTTSTKSTPNAIVLAVKDYATDEGLAGVTLVIKDAYGKTVATVTTDAYGRATVSGLSAGDYTMTQTSVPSGYALDEESYSFSVLSSGSISGTTIIKNKALSETTVLSGSETQSDVVVGTISVNTSSTTTQVSSTTETVSTAATTYTNGSIKTGVETEAEKSKVPVIAGVAGSIAIIGAAAGLIVKKVKAQRK